MPVTTTRTLPAAILREVQKAVIGKDLVLTKVLLAFLAGGHVLMEDMPGVGKTTLAIAFSKALGLNCRRVQFTPDVLPSGSTFLSPAPRGRDQPHLQQDTGSSAGGNGRKQRHCRG